MCTALSNGEDWKRSLVGTYYATTSAQDAACHKTPTEGTYYTTSEWDVACHTELTGCKLFLLAYSRYLILLKALCPIMTFDYKLVLFWVADLSECFEVSFSIKSCFARIWKSLRWFKCMDIYPAQTFSRKSTYCC